MGTRSIIYNGSMLKLCCTNNSACMVCWLTLDSWLEGSTWCGYYLKKTPPTVGQADHENSRPLLQPEQEDNLPTADSADHEKFHVAEKWSWVQVHLETTLLSDDQALPDKTPHTGGRVVQEKTPPFHEWWCPARDWSVILNFEDEERIAFAVALHLPVGQSTQKNERYTLIHENFKKKNFLAQNDYVKKSLLAILYMANIWSILIWTKILLHENF